jgi:hypothetical protein
MAVYNDPEGRPRGSMVPLSTVAAGGPAPGTMTPGGGDDWFAAQGAPPAQGMAPPIQNGMASAQQSLTALQNSPGYQFRLGEGLKALERSAAARGTLLTGGTLKGLTRFGQEFASNEYDKRYNQEMELARLGFGAAGMSANQNTQYGQMAGDLLTQQGNVNAAGKVDAANAWNQGLGGAGNAFMQMYALSQMYPRGGQYPGTPPYFPPGTMSGVPPTGNPRG